MASWDEQTLAGKVFDNSPAESLLSAPGDMYPSLFSTSTPGPNTFDALDMATPTSFVPETADRAATSPAAAAEAASVSTPKESVAGDDAAPATEKKQTKKRKSWGQVLPEPKTNLPPRKRAKTEDEKEQRRVERVLRNRRAAQSSRERKRQEVEALELRNNDLEARIHEIEKTNMMLMEELNKYRRNAGVVTRPSLMDSLPGASVALSQELFSSQDGHKSLIDGLVFPEPSGSTVDPASLSPEPTEQMVAGQVAPSPKTPTAPAPTASKPADLTQHSAAMLCDLQCQQSAELPRSWTASQRSPASSTPELYVLESGLLSSPNSVDFESDYLDGDASALFASESFDISQFLNDDGSAVVSGATAANGHLLATDAELGHHFADLENYFSSENINLQPQSGASATGCDDGGIAVGI
ncbi:related to Transcriptional activator hac1 [Cephalotrichum gorgonifer]|uniref:Related to Transcriptional activator hac1 n=1 Tax=Cephalotrichum gorgonifer TaxID=2041049 RepID=A0AAE8N7U4_9PEZI|nr:related to Transcriptional activator hac1 [Cephalotrichum gorgonifer]